MAAIRWKRKPVTTVFTFGPASQAASAAGSANGGCSTVGRDDGFCLGHAALANSRSCAHLDLGALLSANCEVTAPAVPALLAALSGAAPLRLGEFNGISANPGHSPAAPWARYLSNAGRWLPRGGRERFDAWLSPHRYGRNVRQ